MLDIRDSLCFTTNSITVLNVMCIFSAIAIILLRSHQNHNRGKGFAFTMTVMVVNQAHGI